MASYEFLAGSYDAFTTDVDYPRWCSYIEKHFARLKKPVHTVLDLACGTGSLTAELAGRGYEVTGVDLSAEMLALAEEKCRDLDPRPRFFCEPMENLRLPRKVDACVCCLDSVNYVLNPRKLQRAFRRVFDCLEPGGLFLFDADTPEKLESMDGQVFLDETENEYCVWRGEYASRRRVCSFWMDIFRREGAIWRRGEELHEEFAYTMDELEAYLKEAGFVKIKRYGELKFRAPQEGEQRVFFTAHKSIKGE
ncbi:MAG: methyltransferase domain-containing protein [Oscillospiraceae bacterium]|nr:methyltransferase domain-containing protein [Oscillospiraceae bacterium]